MSKKQQFYASLVQTLRLGKRAVQKARQANKNAGVPNVCSRNGKIYYEMPDGTLKMKE